MTQAQTTSMRAAMPVGDIAQLTERCAYAEAIAAERYYGALSDTYAEAIARGRSPRAMLDVLERETPAVCLDGEGRTEDVYLDASRFRAAIATLPDHAAVRIYTCGATDPVVIQADDGTTLATIEPLDIDAWEPVWPSIARQEWGQ